MQKRNDTITANKRSLFHTVRFDPEEHPALARFAEFLNEQDMEVCLNKVVHGMEESDWVVLRLLINRLDDTDETDRATEYLLEKYGEEVTWNCTTLLLLEIERKRLNGMV